MFHAKNLNHLPCGGEDEWSEQLTQVDEVWITVTDGLDKGVVELFRGCAGGDVSMVQQKECSQELGSSCKCWGGEDGVIPECHLQAGPLTHLGREGERMEGLYK